MNKRDFVLGACAMVAAGVGQAGGGHAGAPPPPGAAGRLARLPDLATDSGCASWRRYVGESFDRVGLAAPLVLRSVEAHRIGAAAEQFTLVFESAPGQPAGSATLRLRHRASGQPLQVFVQSAGTGDGGVGRHRAEFNVLA